MTSEDSRIGQNVVTVLGSEEANGRGIDERMSLPRIAVLVPCFNEALTIGKVVDDFRAVVPQAKIYVFDNNSSDDSAAIARASSADVIRVPRQGKGNVVRTMMSAVDADIYVMVDGDDTYPAEYLPAMMQPVYENRADMVVGARLGANNLGAFRSLHHIGNQLFCWLITTIFGSDLKDILSGYRVFNRHLAKTLPIISSGFEVEAEISIQALYYDFTILEIDIPYRLRPEGSSSKLNTFQDGVRILLKVFHLLRAYKPLTFFGGMGLLGLLVSVLTGTPAFPMPGTANPGAFSWTGVLHDSATVFGVVFTSTGIIVHTLNYRVKELHLVIGKNGSARR